MRTEAEIRKELKKVEQAILNDKDYPVRINSIGYKDAVPNMLYYWLVCKNLKWVLGEK